MDSLIKNLARENQAEMLRGIAATSQVRIAELVGISEATVSRWKDREGELEKLSVFAAACGLRFVRADVKHIDNEHLRALAVLAQRALRQDATASGWGEL